MKDDILIKIWKAEPFLTMGHVFSAHQDRLQIFQMNAFRSLLRYRVSSDTGSHDRRWN
jgi:hypothetical protein